jgi:hypothetical protein
MQFQRKQKRRGSLVLILEYGLLADPCFLILQYSSCPSVVLFIRLFAFIPSGFLYVYRMSVLMFFLRFLCLSASLHAYLSLCFLVCL